MELTVASEGSFMLLTTTLQNCQDVVFVSLPLPDHWLIVSHYVPSLSDL